MIGVTGLSWSLGAGFAYIVGAVFVGVSGGHDHWRLELATSAILGVVVVLARRGIPESPRWLLGKGRVAEAEQVILDVYGKKLDLTDEAPAIRDDDASVVQGDRARGLSQAHPHVRVPCTSHRSRRSTRC